MMETMASGTTTRKLGLAALAIAALALGACASDGGSGGGGEAKAESASAKSMAPPPGHPLSKIEVGMSPTEVTKVMGDADSERNYMTGKAFIPFYYGPDTHRSDWIYNGQGRVVFSRNRWSGGLKVIRVDYDPSLGK